MPIIAEVNPSSGPTRDEMVTEIIAQAQGYALAPDGMVTLSTDMDTTQLTMSVDGDVTPGVFEIGEELVLVVGVSDGSCAIHPRGRGWQGSPVSNHTAGDVVVESPSLPRARCAAAINDIVSSLFPHVFGVGEVVGTKAGLFFEVPADAEIILDVRTLAGDEWVRVRAWEAEMSSASALSGRAIRLPGVPDGAEVQVIFGARPEPFSDNDQRWSSTGLSIGLKDVVVLGVLARFAQTLDLGRLTDRFVTARGDVQQPQIGVGFTMARQLKADFQAALDRESQYLRNLYPARVHFVR